MAKQSSSSSSSEVRVPKAQQQQQPQKRKRAAQVSTASKLQSKALFASTRDEVLEIQTELEELAEERRKLIEADTSGTKAILPLLLPSDKKS